MKKYRRLLVALAILMSGIALLPYIGLSAEPFEWQRYADVYEPGPVEIDIQDFAFIPDFVLIPVGTTVRWTNLDGVNHTVTSDTGVFDSGVLAPGESFEYTFNTVGSYGYFCSIHPSMTGTVLVVDQVFNVYLPIIAR